MRKIVLTAVSCCLLLSCVKEVPVTVAHQLEVEFPSDVSFAESGVIYLNLSEDKDIDIDYLSKYVKDQDAATVLVLASCTDSTALLSAASTWGLPTVCAGASADGKFAFAASRCKDAVFKTDGAAYVVLSCPEYTLVAGGYRENILSETAEFSDRVFVLESADDHSSEFSRQSFCECLSAQWGIPVRTSVTFKRDFVYARPAQWTLMSSISVKDNGLWCHFPISFTIMKEL